MTLLEAIVLALLVCPAMPVIFRFIRRIEP